MTNDEREELLELRALFDLSYSRSQDAIAAWQEYHPGNESVWPDLGKLFEWLLERHHRLEAIDDNG